MKNEKFKKLKENFKNLEQYRNSVVRVIMAYEGSEDVLVEGTLRHISPYRYIVVEFEGFYNVLPFVGNIQGVKEIRLESDEIVYANDCMIYPKVASSDADKVKFANIQRKELFGTRRFNLALGDDDYYTEAVDAFKKQLFLEGKTIAKKMNALQKSEQLEEN